MFTTYRDAIAQIEEFGLEMGSPVVDGRIHRCCYRDEKRSYSSGYYKLKEIYKDGDTLVDGIFGAFRVDEKPFQIERRVDLGLNDAKFAKIKAQYQERAAEQYAKEKEDQSLAAVRAQTLWDAASEIGGSPYLEKKMVEPFGVRFHGPTILIPMCKEGKITSLQSVTTDGKKKYLPNGDIKGAYFLIPGSSRVALCEGFATGASIYMATGWTVAVCFSAGGMVTAAPYFKKKDTVICADNDEKTERKIGTNPGVKFAKRAAAALECQILLVDNGADLDITDFNDLHTQRGLDEVRRQLNV